jgi:hypothetical protein
VPAEEGPPSYGVLAAQVVSLRRELADAVAVAEETRAELGRARERIAELEARLKQSPRHAHRRPALDTGPWLIMNLAGGEQGARGERLARWTSRRSHSPVPGCT